MFQTFSGLKTKNLVTNYQMSFFEFGLSFDRNIIILTNYNFCHNLKFKIIEPL